MAKIDFTDAELKSYFKDRMSHHFFKDTVDKSMAMRRHADGGFPGELIECRRPHEAPEVIEYRKKIFVDKTKPAFSKIVASLSKIRRSADWSIKYQNGSMFSRIADDETLEQYCDFHFPYFTSLTNWTFSVLLKNYLVDPNALIFVFPQQIDVAENEYLKPYPVIFSSEHVLDFVQEDYAVLINPLGSIYYSQGKAMAGESYYIVTTQRVQRFDQVDGKKRMLAVLDYQHGLGILPVFRIGAVVVASDGINYLHESRIASIIPELDEAIREYSDLQAAKVMNIYPERWEYTSQECPTCKGNLTITNPDQTEGQPLRLPCPNPNCHDGFAATGPYSKILVRPGNALNGGEKIPLPPAGFVEKDTKIVELQDAGVDKHIYNALASINFQFLEDTPQNQSGTAKEVDKDELNNTVHSIAEDIVRTMDNIYTLIALTRYSSVYSIDDIINKMLPVVSVPEKYDILSSSHLEQELANAKTNKINPLLQNALEVEYASKKFNTDPDVRNQLLLILKLDPLANIIEDDKMSRLSNKGITLETYIISSNIQEFVQRAIDEDPEFSERPLKDQKAKIKGYATEQITAQDTTTAILRAIEPKEDAAAAI